MGVPGDFSPSEWQDKSHPPDDDRDPDRDRESMWRPEPESYTYRSSETNYQERETSSRNPDECHQRGLRFRVALARFDKTRNSLYRMINESNDSWTRFQERRREVILSLTLGHELPGRILNLTRDRETGYILQSEIQLNDGVVALCTFPTEDFKMLAVGDQIDDFQVTAVHLDSVYINSQPGIVLLTLQRSLRYRDMVENTVCFGDTVWQGLEDEYSFQEPVAAESHRSGREPRPAVDFSQVPAATDAARPQSSEKGGSTATSWQTIAGQRREQLALTPMAPSFERIATAMGASLDPAERPGQWNDAAVHGSGRVPRPDMSAAQVETAGELVNLHGSPVDPETQQRWRPSTRHSQEDSADPGSASTSAGSGNRKRWGFRQ